MRFRNNPFRFTKMETYRGDGADNSGNFLIVKRAEEIILSGTFGLDTKNDKIAVPEDPARKDMINEVMTMRTNAIVIAVMTITSTPQSILPNGTRKDFIKMP